MDQYKVYTFTKKIKGTNVAFKEIVDPSDVVKIGEIVSKLENLPHVTVSSLQEVRLRTNPRTWVKHILKSYPSIAKKDAANLLIDFTDMMRTRMRDDTKYVLGVLFGGKLLLCHSVFGEETITPEWKIIPRMLDVDNVLRFVSFEMSGGEYKVKYWERDASTSFVEWLGLPRKQAFLFGGRYRVVSEIGGAVVEFQLTEEEMESWLNEHPELEEGKFELPSPVRVLNIREVRVASQRYNSVADFIQDFKAEKQGIPKYQRRYESIKESQVPLFAKFYDEKYQVIRLENEEKFVEVSKEAKGVDILFADGEIEIRASYLKDISRRCLNGERVQIVHVAERFKAHPIKMGSIEIYNNLRVPQIISALAEYYQEGSILDKRMDVLFKFLFFENLRQANSQSPIAFVLELLAEEMKKEISLDGKVAQTEDTLVEYKSRDFFSGRDEAIVQRFVGDIETKMRTTSHKVYLVGVEDSGSIDLLPISRLKSDRITNIRERVAEALPYVKIRFLPIVIEGGGLILVTVER